MLSAVFPEGEDFFVRSVRSYRDQITDPVLKEQVKGFIGQEALHGREHRAFNERLQELGYPTRFTDKRVKIGLGIFSKVAPKRTSSPPAGLEHYTATLAEALCATMRARAEFNDRRDPHALHRQPLEETEHKSVPSTCSSTSAATTGSASERCTASTSASCSAWCCRSGSRWRSTATPDATRSRRSQPPPLPPRRTGPATRPPAPAPPPRPSPPPP